MFSIASSSLFGQDAVNRRPAYAESSRNRACRLTARVHALGQSGFGFIECLRSSDVLPTRATRLAGSGAAFPAQFKFEFRKTREYACDHSTRCVRRIYAFLHGVSGPSALGGPPRRTK
jgi:hypothetical protein